MRHAALSLSNPALLSHHKIQLRRLDLFLLDRLGRRRLLCRLGRRLDVNKHAARTGSAVLNHSGALHTDGLGADACLRHLGACKAVTADDADDNETEEEHDKDDR